MGTISNEARKIPVLAPVRFGKSQVGLETWKKASIKFYGYTLYFKLHNFVKKVEYSGDFRTNDSALCKQG